MGADDGSEDYDSESEVAVGTEPKITPEDL